MDFAKKIDQNTYTHATKSLYPDPTDRYDLNPANTQIFLNKVYDRGQHYNISCLEVPSDKDDLANSNKINYCKNHKQFTHSHLKAYVDRYILTDTRQSQDDGILLRILQESLGETAYKSISTDRTDYIVQGEESGLLLMYQVLDQSAVDTTVDPDVIRKRLAHSADKFVELGHDVKQFNTWISEQVDQLRQTGMEEKDLEYLRAFVAAAYETSPDKEFLAYVQSQMDYIRDNPTEPYTWKKLMSRASKKVDAMKQAASHAALAKKPAEDPILTLQAEVKQNRKTIEKLTKKASKANKRREKKEKKKQGKRNAKGKAPFPEALKNKPKPADTSRYEVHNGEKYWWCSHHEKWGCHPLEECEAAQKAAADSGGNQQNNDRGGRYVKALTAITKEK